MSDILLTAGLGESVSAMSGQGGEGVVSEKDSSTHDESWQSPNVVTMRIIMTEIKARETIKGIRTRLDQQRSDTARVTEWLQNPKSNLHNLQSVGVNTKALERLLEEQSKYQASGALKKAFLDDPRERVILEVSSLLSAQRRGDQSLQDIADQADARRLRDIRALESLVEKLHARDGRISHMMMTSPEGYIGDTLRKAGYTGGLPHRMWTVDPVPGFEWTRLPYIAHNRASTLWLPGNPGLNFQDACTGVRGMVLEQMAVALPRLLQLTWIDPATRGGSAGPLLELLEFDKDLIDGQVWSESDHIDAALRRISDHIAYVEQRCLKDRFGNVDEYNAQAGSLAEADRLLVVTGFPKNFTTASIERLNQIDEHGHRAGVTVHVVMDEAIGRTIGINVHHECPRLNSWYNGGFTQWNTVYPQGCGLPGGGATARNNLD